MQFVFILFYLSRLVPFLLLRIINFNIMKAAVIENCSLSDDEIVRLCQLHLAQQSQPLSNASSGRKVIKVADGVVVKFGLGVTYQEASAQKLVFERVDQNIVRIPRVYRFFSRKDMGYWSTGYLIMEHIEGENLEQIAWDKDSMLPRIAAAVREIHSISSRIPGPVSGGEAHGSLWSEYGSGIGFRDIEDLQAWMNKRLSFTEETVSITDESMCLCHLDLAPRNFMIDPAGRLCLLDWATAGFYPRYFELWSVDFSQHVLGGNFGPELLQQLKPTQAEMLEVAKLYSIYRYNARCSM